MDTLFVARIYNNRLGNCTNVSSYNEGKNLIRQYVKDQFERTLTEEEEEILENQYEFFNDEDPDNVVSFTIGSLNY
jgi:hypothetical protein